MVPVCAPELIRRYAGANRGGHPRRALIEIAWEARHRVSAARGPIGRGRPALARGNTATSAFSQSDAAIDAALCGGGFVLGPISMIADHVRQGRLVVPIDRRLTMPEPYFLAWDRDTLDRPLAAGFRNALIAAGRQQSALSSGKDSLAAGPPEGLTKPAPLACKRLPRGPRQSVAQSSPPARAARPDKSAERT